MTFNKTYKIKHNIEEQGKIMSHGLSRNKGIDYEETFAYVARYTSIRSILSISIMMKWNVH